MSLRVILAGFGWWGQHLLPRLRDPLGFDVVGLCAPELDTPDHEGVTLPIWICRMLSMKQLPISCLGERGQARSCPKAKAAFSLGSLQVHG